MSKKLSIFLVTIREKIKERNSDERCNLILRRIFSIGMSLIVLLISAGLIAGAYVLRGLAAKPGLNSVLNFGVNY